MRSTSPSPRVFKTASDEVQSKKKHRYVTFKIDDGKIRVDKVGPRESNYDNFLKDLRLFLIFKTVCFH